MTSAAWNSGLHKKLVNIHAYQMKLLQDAKAQAGSSDSMGSRHYIRNKLPMTTEMKQKKQMDTGGCMKKTIAVHGGNFKRYLVYDHNITELTAKKQGRLLEKSADLVYGKRTPENAEIRTRLM